MVSVIDKIFVEAKGNGVRLRYTNAKGQRITTGVFNTFETFCKFVNALKVLQDKSIARLAVA